MPNSRLARAGSCALTLASTLMTGATVLAFLPLMASAEANPEAGAGHYYFFGDSATGQGNWSAIVGEQGEDHAPYSSNNGFQRESNGLIWAEMLGRDVDIILDPDADSMNLNFAISGAHMTRSGDLAAFGIETGVVTQTELFGALVANGAITVGNKDVAFMLAGGNDFLDRLEHDDPADEIMVDVAQAAAANVRSLAEAGVKTIILSEIQPLQHAPQFADAPEVQAALTDLVLATNAAILSAVEAEEFPGDVNVVTMKYGAMVDYIVANGAALGMPHTNAPCYTDSGDLCSEDPEVQNRYLFFDDLHFTERAHRLEAEWWNATLEGANGTAARQTARLPRILYETQIRHRRYVRPGTHTDAEDRFGAWLTPLRGTFALKATSAAPGAEIDAEGVVLGMEGRLARHFVAGTALAVGKSDASFRDAGRYTLKGGALSLYGALDYQEDGRLSLSVTKGGHEVDDIRRMTGVEQLSASGATESSYWEAELAARSSDNLGGFEIDHGLSLSAGRVRVDGYTESGATGLTLRFEDQTLNYRIASLDAVIRGPAWRVSPDLAVRPLVDGAYAHQFGDDDHALTSRLVDNTAQAVTIRSHAGPEDRLDAGIGAELLFGERWNLSARYARQWTSDLRKADEAALTLRTHF